MTADDAPRCVPFRLGLTNATARFDLGISAATDVHLSDAGPSEQVNDTDQGMDDINGHRMLLAHRQSEYPSWCVNAIHGSRLASASRPERLEHVLARMSKLANRDPFAGPNNLPSRHALLLAPPRVWL
jgi:hypothetical protein